MVLIVAKENPRVGVQGCAFTDDEDFNELRAYCTNIVLSAFVDVLLWRVAVPAFHQMNDYGVGLEDIFVLAHDDRNDGMCSGG